MTTSKEIDRKKFRSICSFSCLFPFAFVLFETKFALNEVKFCLLHRKKFNSCFELENVIPIKVYLKFISFLHVNVVVLVRVECAAAGSDRHNRRSFQFHSTV